jgi:hypothetical protein
VPSAFGVSVQLEDRFFLIENIRRLGVDKENVVESGHDSQLTLHLGHDHFAVSLVELGGETLNRHNCHHTRWLVGATEGEYLLGHDLH